MESWSSALAIEPRLRRSVVTIGNFDGLHLGHRKIIARLKELSSAGGGVSCLITFDPHPRKVLAPQSDFKCLFSKHDLSTELEKEKIDHLVFEPFSRDLSQMEPETFLKDFVVKPLSPTSLVVGYDFTFGAGRKGTLEVLKNILDAWKINLEVIPPFKINDTIVSSTKVREALSKGQIEWATEMLGRNYYVEGIVERGEGRGKKIGVPTANLQLTSELYPALGVYAGYFVAQGKKFKAVANVGFNPTFESQKQKIKFEVHVFNFNGDLYGEHVRFEMVKHLREEMKFEGVEKLVQQIQKDIVDAQKTLA